MLGLLRRVAAGEKTALTKSIRLIWATRSLELMNWVRAELQNINELQDVTGIKVSVEVFVTRNANELVQSSKGFFVTCNARFDTKLVLAQEVEYAKEMGSITMGIQACGSSDLVIAVSNEAARLNYNVLRGRLGTLKDIVLKTERFIM
ncbi:hypothetical protein MVES1_000049 [Malassezia vespertilionis]|nr:uncharacterized protein MVES1_000049 [Malassezia vespertilionis]WFD04725.1 hypothetical protein MVES1_000049 [Malassezia vespertilionis]